MFKKPQQLYFNMFFGFISLSFGSMLILSLSVQSYTVFNTHISRIIAKCIVQNGTFLRVKKDSINHNIIVG